MRYKALHTFTDKLPLVSKEKHNPIIGKDTILLYYLEFSMVF